METHLNFKFGIRNQISLSVSVKTGTAGLTRSSILHPQRTSCFLPKISYWKLYGKLALGQNEKDGLGKHTSFVELSTSWSRSHITQTPQTSSQRLQTPCSFQLCKRSHGASLPGIHCDPSLGVIAQFSSYSQVFPQYPSPLPARPCPSALKYILFHTGPWLFYVLDGYLSKHLYWNFLEGKGQVSEKWQVGSQDAGTHRTRAVKTSPKEEFPERAIIHQVHLEEQPSLEYINSSLLKKLLINFDREIEPGTM